MSFKHLALCLTLNLFFSFFLKGFTEDLSKLNVFFGEKAPIVSSFLSEVNGELSKKQKEKSNSIKSQLNEKQITIFDNLIQEKIGSSTSPDQVKIEPVKSSVSNSGSPITNSNIKKYSKRTSYTSKSEIIEREEKPPKKTSEDSIPVKRRDRTITSSPESAFGSFSTTGIEPRDLYSRPTSKLDEPKVEKTQTSFVQRNPQYERENIAVDESLSTNGTGYYQGGHSQIGNIQSQLKRKITGPSLESMVPLLSQEMAEQMPPSKIVKIQDAPSRNKKRSVARKTSSSNNPIDVAEGGGDTKVDGKTKEKPKEVVVEGGDTKADGKEEIKPRKLIVRGGDTKADGKIDTKPEKDILPKKSKTQYDHRGGIVSKGMPRGFSPNSDLPKMEPYIDGKFSKLESCYKYFESLKEKDDFEYSGRGGIASDTNIDFNVTMGSLKDDSCKNVLEKFHGKKTIYDESSDLRDSFSGVQKLYNSLMGIKKYMYLSNLDKTHNPELHLALLCHDMKKAKQLLIDYPELYFTYEIDADTFNEYRLYQLMDLGLISKEKCLEYKPLRDDDSTRKLEVLELLPDNELDSIEERKSVPKN